MTRFKTGLLIAFCTGLLLKAQEAPKGKEGPQRWEQTIQAWAEKVSSVSDYQLGRAPSTPNAPRTKGGTIAMMQAGRLAFSVLVAQHAEAFIELCRRNMELKRKYARSETPFRVLNKEEGVYEEKMITRRAFEMDADFQFVLNPNRQEEHALQMALFGVFQQAVTFALQAPQIAPQIRAAAAEVYESAGAKYFARIWPENMIVIQPQQLPVPGAVPGGPSQAQAMGPPMGPMPPAMPGAGPMPMLPMGMGMMPPTPEMGRPEPVPAVPVTPEEENVLV